MRTALHEQLRSFGRTYTKKFGLLNGKPYHSDLTLLQSRIVFELHHRNGTLSKELGDTLQLDKGYLSRSIAQLSKANIVKAQANPSDQREKFLRLTRKGEQLFRKIDHVSQVRSADFLKNLTAASGAEFASHLATAELLMGERPLKGTEVVLRSLRSGDLGWVIGRHGEIYKTEFGWNTEFENVVGEIAVGFAVKHNPKFERAWIATARGVRLGCVFLVRESVAEAKLRILLVDPLARGLGLGSKLVKECIRFAKQANYKKLSLWTNSVLHSARKIYLAEGFKLEREEAHESFGKKLTGQFWELKL